MAKPLSYFERLNKIGQNKGLITDTIARTLEREHSVPADLARKVATSTVIGLDVTAFDQHGALMSEHYARAMTSALGVDEVKRAITSVANGNARTDATPMHELSQAELLQADADAHARLTPEQQRAERRARGEYT